jgi:hypothetical protein
MFVFREAKQQFIFLYSFGVNCLISSALDKKIIEMKLERAKREKKVEKMRLRSRRLMMMLMVVMMLLPFFK